ncbi:transposable element Tcb2 transposase [Trichonephila clavipes]|nr:transposable element Tcb2 transposase [Trichonephila clavipes]
MRVKVQANALTCIEKIIDKLEKTDILDEVMPMLSKATIQDPTILMPVVRIYKFMLGDKRYGLTVNLLASKVMPSLIPVVVSPSLKLDQHRTARLQWCREHHNWTEQDWACVLFSDESRFSLSSDCRRQLIWRERGTAYRPENIQEKDRYPTCSIMVWAGIMINGRTRLHVVANGTMTGQRYIDEVLLPHVRLFHGAVGDKFVFMDDNATCHRTLAVQDCLDSEGIQRLVWPARSPDLNPIENVWDALGRQVAGRNYPPTNKSTLIRALTEEWDNLPQQLLDNVLQSMFTALVELLRDMLEHVARSQRNKLKLEKLSIPSTDIKMGYRTSTEIIGSNMSVVQGIMLVLYESSRTCYIPEHGLDIMVQFRDQLIH